MRKISRGCGFRGAFGYVYSDDEAKFLGASACVMATTQLQLVREFRAAHVIRPDCKKPVWHQALRLPDDEIVSHERQLEIAHEYMRQMGFESQNHQYAVIAHGDNHVHIVASRVGLGGKLFYGKNENLISTRVVSGLEKKFRLRITKGPEYVETLTPSGEIKHRIKPAAASDEEKPKRASRKEEMRHARLREAGQAPAQSPRQHIVAALTEARQVGKKEGLAGFLRTAESRGVEVRTVLGARMSQKELIAAAIAVSEAIAAALAGIVFRALGRDFSGSRLGGGFSAPKLSAELRIGQGKNDQALILEREQAFGEGRQIATIPQPQPQSNAPRKGKQYGYHPTQPAARGNADLAPIRAASAGAHRATSGIRSIDGVRRLSGLDVVRHGSPDRRKQARISPDVLLQAHERHHLVGGREKPADRLRRAAEAAPAARVGRPGLGGSILAWLESVDGEPAAMTYPTIPNPSLGGGLLGRRVFEPAPAAETPPPPPPPPSQPLMMRPQFEVRYEADLLRIEALARTIHRGEKSHYMTHPTTIAALAKARAARDQAEDAEFPGRRGRREKSDAAINARIDDALAYQAKAKAQGANVRRNRDDYYKEACAGWITTYRATNGKAAVPSDREWREFDRTQGVQALIRGHAPDNVAPALTRLSGVAVRRSEALETQARNEEAFDLVIAEYGNDMLKKVKAGAVADERAAAGLKSTAQRRKGPRA